MLLKKNNLGKGPGGGVYGFELGWNEEEWRRTGEKVRGSERDRLSLLERMEREGIGNGNFVVSS